jgi:hypothetical protein
MRSARDEVLAAAESWVSATEAIATADAVEIRDRYAEIERAEAEISLVTAVQRWRAEKRARLN